MIVRLTPLTYQFRIPLWPAFSVIILFLFSGVSVSAQYLQPSFKNYTVDDGLPSSEVHVAIQDHDGYMWFGTDNGLSRFDGYEFKNYGTKDGLLNPVVFDLKVDKKGTLWISTMLGDIFYYQDEKIIPYKFNYIIKELKGQFEYATDIFINDTNKSVSVNLYGYGLLTIDSLGNTSSIINEMEEIIIIDSMDVFSFSLRAKVPTKPRDRRSHFSKIRTYPNGKSKAIHNEFFWVDRGLNIHKIDSNEYIIKTGNRTSLIKDGIFQWHRNENFIINTIFHIDSSTLWAGLHTGFGIRQYNSKEDLKNNNYSSLLNGASISNIYKDKHDGLWATSTNQGIFYSPNMNAQIYSNREGPIESNISSVTVGNKNIYFSHWTKNIINFNTSQRTSTPIENPKITDNISYNNDIEYDNLREQLIGGKGSFIYNEEWTSINQYYNNGYTTIYKIGNNIYDDQIIITSRSGLITLNLKNNTLRESYGNPSDFNIKFLYADFDNEGNKWVCRVDGLWKWTNGSLVRPKNMHPYLLERIESIQSLTDNNLVLGTKGRGILIWNQENFVDQITTEDGLTSNMIENVFIDSLDQIWVGTLNGLNRIRFQSDSTFIVKQFTKNHGLPGNEINKVRRQGEDIWVATTTGLGKIKDTEADSTTVTPIINKFTINGDPLNLDHIDNLNHNENNVSINFVSLNYRAQGDIQYRYRLQYNEEWEYTTNRTLNFPNLSPNSYAIEIQAQNEDGFWSESLSIPFTILSPFWQRPWFLIISGLLLSSIAAGVTRHRQLKEIETLKNEHDIQSQITELERSALQAQMNPHFIFNILNSIQSSINKEDNENASQILAKFAKLIRGTLQNAKAKSITLEEEINYIKSYLYLEQVRHKEERFQYEVTHDEEEDLLSIFIPPMLVQPYVENAVKHGTRNNKSAKIEVHYAIANSHVNVTVKDNGPGISKSPSLQDHQGMGMDITQRRLELLNEGTLDDFLKIEQIKNDADMVIGTQINLKIKTKNFQTV